MNIKNHLQARLNKIKTQPELNQFMYKQGFCRDGQSVWQCTQKPFTGLKIAITRTEEGFTL